MTLELPASLGLPQTSSSRVVFYLPGLVPGGCSGREHPLVFFNGYLVYGLLMLRGILSFFRSVWPLRGSWKGVFYSNSRFSSILGLISSFPEGSVLLRYGWNDDFCLHFSSKSRF